jgi:diguanylate cyclase (GGDEF)-like protein
LNDRLDWFLQQVSRRHGSSFALLFVDLDRFKPINDTHGHVVGDLLLTTLAERFRLAVRPGDTVARVGGDEFCVLVAEGDDEIASQVAERLLAVAAAPLPGRPDVATTASIGIVVARDGDVDAADLYARSDRAMYRAKMAGGNRFEVARDTDAAPAPARL